MEVEIEAWSLLLKLGSPADAPRELCGGDSWLLWLTYGLLHCKQKCGHTVVIRVIWGDLTCSGQGFVHRMTTSSIQAMSVDSAATI